MYTHIQSYLLVLWRGIDIQSVMQGVIISHQSHTLDAVDQLLVVKAVLTNGILEILVDREFAHFVSRKELSHTETTRINGLNDFLIAIECFMK